MGTIYILPIYAHYGKQMAKKQLGESTIDERNRITLMKSILKTLKIKPGDLVYFELEDENICIKPYGLKKINNQSDNNRLM